jgi:predicted ATPase
VALQREGGLLGFKEVISRGLDPEKDVIAIEIKFRMEIADRQRLVTYRLEIGQAGGKPIVRREILRYKRGRYGSPFQFINFENGSGTAVSNEEDFNKPDEELDREEQTLGSADILAIKGLGQFDRFRAAKAFRQLIENWHISDIHINSARGAKPADEGEHVSSQGDNLPSVALRLYNEHRPIFDEVCRKMEQRVPGVKQSQVFISTHSPEFLNAVELESIFVLEKEQGVSRVWRVQDDPLIGNLMNEGDHAGYLWDQGMFKGIGQRIAAKPQP